MNIKIKYNVLLDEWKEDALDSLKKGFEKHLSSCDLTFLDFADQAENSRVQSAFMDAQRELWVKADQLSNQFAAQLTQAMKTFPAPLPQIQSPKKDGELDLVNLDAYEEDLALQTISNQFERNNSQLVYALQQRLTVLNQGKPIDSKQIPASPFQLSHIYAETLKDLEIAREPILVMYTQFEKHVIGLLPALFGSLNSKLVESGILPTLKYSYHKTPYVEGQKHKTEGAEQEGNPPDMQQPDTSPTSTSNEALQRIRDLLLATRSESQRATKATSVSAAPKISQPEILQTTESVIAQTMQAMPEEAWLDDSEDAGDLVIVDRKLLSKVSQALRQQRELIKDKAGSDRLDSKQEDVIDIVGMLFDQMLDDEQLHGRAKAILSHLHTSFIKIGLRDADFLSNAQHPARRYFEQAIESSRRWINDDDISIGITPLLRNQVLQVVKYRKQENQDFERYHDELIKEHDRLEEKNRIIEKRSLEAEQGKSRLEDAKRTARMITADLFRGSMIPASSAIFINNVWIDYLTLILLRNDGSQENTDWQNAIALAEDMVIQSKLAANGHPEKEAIEDLADALDKTVGRLLPQHARNIDQFIDSLFAKTEKTIELPDHHEAHIELINESGDEHARSELHKLAELPVGTWFEFDRSGVPQRGRLAWFNPNTERFFFVDINGKKLALVSVRELTADLQSGRTKYFVDDERGFWDKAMSTIRRLLEKNRLASV